MAHPSASDTILKNTMSLGYLLTQLSTLENCGANTDQAYAALGLNPDKLPPMAKRVPLGDVEKIYEAAAQELADPLIAMRVGYQFRVPTFGETGSIYSYCQNMVQVCEMNEKYQKLAIDAGQLTHVKNTAQHMFTLTPYPDAPPYPHIYLMIMGAYASTFQWLNWTINKEIKAAHFIFSPPENLQLLNDIFRCPLKFNQPVTGLELFVDSMEIPLSTADPEKLAYAVSKLDAILESQSATETFIKATRQSINASLNLGAVSLSVVAGRLSMTERQLREKLKTAGVSFRTLLESERKALFSSLFHEGESFAAISQTLGYNDQAAFNRAFKRWYGMSPSAYTSASAQNEPKRANKNSA